MLKLAQVARGFAEEWIDETGFDHFGVRSGAAAVPKPTGGTLGQVRFVVLLTASKLKPQLHTYFENPPNQ